MTGQEEAAFEARAEAHFKGHRGLPAGRNFLWNAMRFHDGAVKQRYDEGMCRTFPHAPGSRMCGACAHESCALRRVEP